MTGLQARLVSTAAQVQDVIQASFSFTLPCKRNQGDTVFLLAGLPSAFDIKKNSVGKRSKHREIYHFARLQCGKRGL